MENMTMFPMAAGFLFPDGTLIPNVGKGHENTAFRILQEAGVDVLNVNYPEGEVQQRYAAIIIRYRWGERLIYLPPRRPETHEGCIYFQEAIKFYEEKGFSIVNLHRISLEYDDFVIRDFIGEEFEELKFFSKCTNYTDTVIQGKNGKYMYNPERVGD